MVSDRCVIDCSVAASWILKDEFRKSTEDLLSSIITGEIELIQPDLWWYEMLNLLKSSVLRGRIRHDHIQKTLFSLKEIPMSIVSSEDIDNCLLLENSINYGLSAYDSTYLTLAETRGLQLFTFDKELLALKDKFDFIIELL
ncbi:MAG: type II toxin-antitoxin system VapC family toxin [Planctomycetota bacterium]|jgi:predicted nucleic acid-binding protein